MFKRQWSWFRKLKPLNRLAVISGLASVIAFPTAVLTLRNEILPRHDSVQPVASVPSVLRPIGYEAHTSGPNSPIIQASPGAQIHQTLVKRPKMETKSFLVGDKPDAMILVAASPDQEMVYMATLVGAFQSIASMGKKPAPNVPQNQVLVSSETEVTKLGEQMPSKLALGRILIKVRILDGPHKNKVGWVGDDLVKTREVPVGD